MRYKIIAACLTGADLSDLSAFAGNNPITANQNGSYTFEKEFDGYMNAVDYLVNIAQTKTLYNRITVRVKIKKNALLTIGNVTAVIQEISEDCEETVPGNQEMSVELHKFITHPAIKQAWLAYKLYDNIKHSSKKKVCLKLGKKSTWKPWEIEKLNEIRKEFKENI